MLRERRGNGTPRREPHVSITCKGYWYYHSVFVSWTYSLPAVVSYVGYQSVCHDIDGGS